MREVFTPRTVFWLLMLVIASVPIHQSGAFGAFMQAKETIGPNLAATVAVLLCYAVFVAILTLVQATMLVASMTLEMLCTWGSQARVVDRNTGAAV